jgi:hypothetical protein
MVKTQELYFDEFDSFYLAGNLSVAQIRREISRAEVRESVAEIYRGTEFETPDDLFPWGNYAAVCRKAIEFIRQSATKTQPSPGKVDVEVIKARNDIVTIIEGYTKLRKAGKNFTGRCPIHDDKHPSLTVYPDKQTWHCFGACSTGGDVISFIQAVEHTDFLGAVAILGGA